MREARIDTQIEIAETGLTPGHRLMLRAEAADAYNLDGQHIGAGASLGPCRSFPLKRS